MRDYIDLLTEATSEEIGMSLFGLAKSSDGKFKSEKQASFLLSKMESSGDGKWHLFYKHIPISYGKSDRANPSVSWHFILDKEGVLKIIKGTLAKGESVYWERTEQYMAANASRKEKEIKQNEEWLAELTMRIEKIDSELNGISAMGEEARAAIDGAIKIGAIPTDMRDQLFKTLADTDNQKRARLDQERISSIESIAKAKSNIERLSR